MRVYPRALTPAEIANNACVPPDYSLSIVRPAGVPLRDLALLGEQVTVDAGVQLGDRHTGRPASIAATAANGVSVGAGAFVGGISSVGPVTVGASAIVRGPIETESTYQPALGQDQQPTVSHLGSLSESEAVTLTQETWQVAWPQASNGAVLVQAQTSASLVAGRYGDVVVKGNGTLNLATGSYYLDSLSVESGATLNVENTAGPVRLFVRGPIAFAGVLARKLDAANVMLASVGSAPINIDSALRANIWAPGAAVTINSGAGGFRGSVFGKSVAVRPGIPVGHEPYSALECMGADCPPAGPDECSPGGRFFREYVINGEQPPAIAWWLPHPFNLMEDTRDWNCMLSRVGGELDGVTTVGLATRPSQEALVLKEPGAYVGIVNDYWAGSAGEGVSAAAICVHKSCFSSGALHRSGPYWTDADAQLGLLGCNTDTRSAIAAPPDQATFINGFNPWEPNGAGERVWVQQSSTDPSTVNATDSQCGERGESVYVHAHAFRAGALNVPAMFSGPNGERTTIELAGKFSVSSQGGTRNHQERWLLPSRKAVCYLSSIDGKFRGGGEYAALTVEPNPNAGGENYWRLYAQHLSAGAPNGVDAEATCYARDQDACTSAENAAGPECQPLARQRFEWQQGQKPVVMGSAADRACFLTEVSGHFEGSGEWVNIRIKDGMWVLDGGSLQSGVHATAQCVATRSFSAEFTWGQGQAPVALGPATKQACFLTRMTGKFKGGGERVLTWTEGGQWWLGGASSQESVAASARCIPVESYGPEVTWSQGQAPVQLTFDPPDPRTFCFLSRVLGHFEGSGESVFISADATASGALVQTLDGRSRQTEVGGSAICAKLATDANAGIPETPPATPRDCSIIDAGYGFDVETDVCWMSQLYGENDENHGDGGHVAKYECRPHSCFQDPDPESVVNSSPHYFDSAAADGSCTEYSLKLFGFDQVAHLRWFGGSEGRGEWASIEQALNPTSRSELAIHTCRDDGTGATAQSLAIGRPGEIVKFMGPGDVVGPLNTVGEFSVDSLINSTVVMTPVATSQCVFSTIGGKFPGDAEYVRIERVNVAGVERWQLAAHHLSGGGVFASARCFPLIQNPE